VDSNGKSTKLSYLNSKTVENNKIDHISNVIIKLNGTATKKKHYITLIHEPYKHHHSGSLPASGLRAQTAKAKLLFLSLLSKPLRRNVNSNGKSITLSYFKSKTVANNNIVHSSNVIIRLNGTATKNIT
jgi:hypothetical protein